MKFCVCFKTPDALDYLDLDEDESEEALDFARQYVKYGEYITIEFDTDAGTAVAVKQHA